jgi:hypothetical protein
MSSLVLRSLLLPENSQVQNLSGKPALKSLTSDLLTNESTSNLTTLDSLRLSGISSQNLKGRVPIQLIQPAEFETPNTELEPTKNTSPKPSGSATLASLLEFSQEPVIEFKDKKITHPSQANTMFDPNSDLFKPKIFGSYNYKAPAPEAKINVIGSQFDVSHVLNFVDGRIEKTSGKMATAIAKIEDWDRKIGALDAILDEQKKSKTDMSELVVTGSKRLTTARTEATTAREQAIQSFNDAVIEMNHETATTGIRSPHFNELKTTREQMEKLFKNTAEKDKTTMDKVMDYLKSTLSTDNLNKALNFINPLSDKY